MQQFYCLRLGYLLSLEVPREFSWLTYLPELSQTCGQGQLSPLIQLQVYNRVRKTKTFMQDLLCPMSTNLMSSFYGISSSLSGFPPDDFSPLGRGACPFCRDRYKSLRPYQYPGTCRSQQPKGQEKANKLRAENREAENDVLFVKFTDVLVMFIKAFANPMYIHPHFYLVFF